LLQAVLAMKEALRQLLGTARTMLPVLGVIGGFQALVLAKMPADPLLLLLAMLALLLGISLVLKTMEQVIFPIGNALSHELSARGSLTWMLVFGFTLGFAAVIAEPSLIAVAEEAERLSEGRMQATTLRLVVAISVGLALVVGILRSVLGHPIHRYLLGAIALLLLATWATPAEVTGIAMDAGAVSVNIITVPLLVALGVGLSHALSGRSPLVTGFGLLALAVMAPRIAVQIYGLWAYGDAAWGMDGRSLPRADSVFLPLAIPDSPHGALLRDAGTILRSVIPILLVVAGFQLLVFRRGFANPRQLLYGFLWLLVGLFLFLQGLRYGLFPLGTGMALDLAAHGKVYLYLFVFLIGVAATLVEPALIAITRKAEVHDPTLLNASILRWLAACGVGMGLVLGIVRMAQGVSLEWMLLPLMAVLALLAWIGPSDSTALAFDLGGVATSDVTVPLITALSVALSGLLGSGDVMLDAFGLIALASLCPILLVMLYTLAAKSRCRYYTGGQ
jgi:hypothetical protein